jgi:hypothetical protein
MQQPEQDSAARTELPRPVTLPEGQEVAGTRGTPIFDTKSVSIYYGSFRAVTDVSLTIYEHEITASSARPVAARRRCCGRSTG